MEVYSSLRETWETEPFEELDEKKLLPHVRERSRGRSVKKLESKLDGQLNAARTTASDERVADANVAGSGNDWS